MSLDHEFENSFFSPKEATNTTETLGLFRPALDVEDETITESFNLVSKHLDKPKRHFNRKNRILTFDNKHLSIHSKEVGTPGTNMSTQRGHGISVNLQEIE